MASGTNALILPPRADATNAVDIRGLKGPVEIPGSHEWIWWTLGALALAAFSWWAWRRFRARKTAARPAMLIPPHRKAKDRLRAAGELMSDPYAFCSLVSDVVRVYLEERFEWRAPERTTEEFLDEMRSSSVLRSGHQALLEDFLSRCDLVKFARFEPAQTELNAMLEAALRFIDETAPIAGAETEKAEAGAA